MNFEGAWDYLRQNQPFSLETSGGTPFEVRVSETGISYKSGNDQKRPQSKENFGRYFHIWFEEGRREQKYFPNFGKQKSPSARFRYFSSVFRHLENVF